MTGVPLLPALFANARLAVEVAWGADLTDLTGASWTWTDISTDVLMGDGRNIAITLGRADERSVAQPARCALTLKNTGGAYTPFNALSSNWPNVVRNTPLRIRVSLNGGSSWTVRFQGYADGFAPSWDVSARLAIVSVSASGVTRRLNQGRTPLKSAMRRSIIGTSPIAYWPMEDGASSTVAASALLSGTPMSVGAKVPSFSGTSGPAGSDNVVDLSNGGTLQGRVTSSTATSWRIEASVKMPKIAAAAFTTVLGWNTSGGISYWELTHDDDGSGGLFAQYTAADGSFAATFSSPQKNLDDGKWHHVRVDGTKSGGSTNLKVYVDTVQCLNWTVALAFGSVVKVIVNPTGDTTEGVPAIGHIAVWAPWSSSVDTYDAFLGHAGESPQARLVRLCGEEGIPFQTSGFYEARASMGAQGIDTLLNLLRECETAEAGFLYDGLSAGLTYQGISQRYDQATALTLDANAGAILGGIEPVDDDQRNRNLVKISRRSASSATAEDVTGPLGTNAIGTYDTEVTVNHQDDTQLYNRAAWEVHGGTIQGLRYPTATVNIRRTPSLATTWLGIVPGSRADITHLSTLATQHPPGTVGLVMEGWNELLHSRLWSVSVNCSPSLVYDVQKVGDTRLGRLQTGGSSVAAAAVIGATSLTVATAANQLWTTTAAYPSDFPWDADVDGIQVAVSAITSAASDAFGRTVSNGWGTADSGQSWTTSGGSASDYSVGSGRGAQSNGTVNALRHTTLDVGSSDQDFTIDVSLPVASASGAAISQWVLGRFTDTSNYYAARLDLQTTGAVTLALWKRVAGTLSGPLGGTTVTVAATHAANDVWRVRVQVVSSVLRTKAWVPSAGAEPGWTIDTTDTSLTTGTKLGAATRLETGNTNTLPVVTSWDTLAVTNPQTFTVTGVTKNLAAGKSVKTWKGGVIKL